jgi:hypothetical protein
MMMNEQPELVAPMWISGEADGAIPNGSGVIKCNSEEGDMNEDGATGTVVSSIATPETMRAEEQFKGIEFFYFVRWDSAPDIPIGITGNRIRPA